MDKSNLQKKLQFHKKGFREKSNRPTGNGERKLDSANSALVEVEMYNHDRRSYTYRRQNVTRNRLEINIVYSSDSEFKN